MPTVRCPVCEKAVAWGPQSPWRPFCSERCRLIDLGDWIEGRNSIPGDIDDDATGQEWLPVEPGRSED